MLNPALGDVDQTMSQIQLTIANMSFMRLDQLGISVTDVKNRIKELQAETAGMSREQAFQIAVMAELEEQAAGGVGRKILVLRLLKGLKAPQPRGKPYLVFWGI